MYLNIHLLKLFKKDNFFYFAYMHIWWQVSLLKNSILETRCPRFSIINSEFPGLSEITKVTLIYILLFLILKITHTTSIGKLQTTGSKSVYDFLVKLL
jgi:hypothetical protein